MLSLTKQELVPVVVIGFIVLGLSSAPYVLGYGFAAPATVFGGFILDLDDSYSYLTTMQQGLGDGWRYHVLFTPEEHPGAYLHTFYMALGRLSSLLRLSLISMYHIARLVCGLSLLTTAYVFLSLFLPDRDRRLVAYLLVCFSSGLGWLILLSGTPTLGGISPIDFWLMDAYTFFTIFTFPHSAAAVTLLLLVLLFTLRYAETCQRRTLLLGVVSTLGLCVIHPFTVLLVDGVLVMYWLLLLVNRKEIPRREGVAIAVYMLAPLPLVLYYYQVFTADPVLRNWAAQNILPSPPIAHVLLGYGIVLLLAIGGMVSVVRRRNERELLLVAWAVSALVLMYLPFTLQRRMVEGLHVPLCVLATIGLFDYFLPAALSSDWLGAFARWREYDRKGLRRLLIFTVVIATFPSNLYLLAGASLIALENDRPLFYRWDEAVGIDWLKDNTERTDTVLASYQMGRLIPARAGRKVFMGHFHETVDVEQKKRLVMTFYDNATSDTSRRALLTEYRIHYLFHGPVERELGGFDPCDVPYLTEVYRSSSVAIYRVDL